MKIAICTPVYDTTKALFTKCLGFLLIHTAKERPDLELNYMQHEGHLLRNRNEIANAALDWEADYTLWIDSDMVFPKHALLSLLAHELPIVGCNAPTRSDPPRTTAFREIAGGFQAIFTTAKIAEKSPLEEVSSIGLGCALIAAPLLGALGRPVFRPKPGLTTGLGEDVYLCERLREAGERIFIDHAVSVNVGHIGEFVFSNAHAARAASLPNPPGE